MKGREIQASAKEVLMELIKDEVNDLPFSLGVADLKKILPHSDTKIYLMLESGELPGRKMGGKWVVQRSAFLAWFHGAELEKDLANQVIVN
ncbi:MAG: helix-turn-helix domain-containing protein [Halanaerobiales bacterium]